MHKGDFGHVLIVGGSATMLGAGALSALAALRSGAGLVTLAVPYNLIIAAQKKVSNCVMVQDVNSLNKNILSTYSAIAIGPGLGRTPATVKRVLKIIGSSSVPLVIDADALFAVSKKLSILSKTKTPKILTPHPGEMGMLIKKSTAFVQNNRESCARDFAKKHNCVLLLKGNRTVVAGGLSPNGDCPLYVNTTGNPGMATAGSGDVLTGMIAAFLSQGLNAFDAAKWGAYVHGKAGDLAAKKGSRTGLIASDLIENIPRALRGKK
ncbi:MAG TPA: NAD(P)H-hydrate dehydratase [Candidatus Omnitrophota bacterium]|nr:NAD(P)H-hydrate dehydratase [Candidatus Omnitrophota bacterium]